MKSSQTAGITLEVIYTFTFPNFECQYFKGRACAPKQNFPAGKCCYWYKRPEHGVLAMFPSPALSRMCFQTSSCLAMFLFLELAFAAPNEKCELKWIDWRYKGGCSQAIRIRLRI